MYLIIYNLGDNDLALILLFDFPLITKYSSLLHINE